MSRFNLKSVVSGLIIASAVATLPGCSGAQGESTPANRPVAAAPMHQATIDPNRNPFQSSPHFDGLEPYAHKYVTCDNSASLRLLDKWLQIPHDGKLADRCLPFDEVVSLVQRELPRLKASIDDNNRKVDIEWAALQAKIQSIANQSDHLAAANQLLDMECDKNGSRQNLLEDSYYQWTLFLDSTPATVRDAIGKLYYLDESGYGDKLPFRNNDGTDVEKVYDDYTYESAIENGPENRQNPSEGNYWFKAYGMQGSPAATRLIESYYEANRVLSDSGKLPGGFNNGTPGYVCLFR